MCSSIIFESHVLFGMIYNMHATNTISDEYIIL